MSQTEDFNLEDSLSDNSKEGNIVLNLVGTKNIKHDRDIYLQGLKRKN